MSSAEVAKQLKIKTNSLKRLHKELASYQKEVDREKARVEKMKSEGAEEHDLKQAEMVFQESAMMVPQTRQRLEAAFQELQAFLAENEQDVDGTEELTAAKELLAEVQSVIAA